MATIHCPQCHHRLRLAGKPDGSKVRCPRCDEEFTPSEDPPSTEVVDDWLPDLRPPVASPSTPKPRAEDSSEASASPEAAKTRRPTSQPRPASDRPAPAPPNFRWTHCPDCGADLADDAVLCVQCGLHLQTGEVLMTEHRRRRRPRRSWDGDRPVKARVRLSIGIVLASILAGAATTSLVGNVAQGLWVAVVGSLLGVMVPGTYTRIELTTDRRGRPIIRLIPHFIYFRRKPETVQVWKFTRVTIEHTGFRRETTLIVLLALFLLLGGLQVFVLLFQGIGVAIYSMSSTLVLLFLIHWFVLSGRYVVTLRGDGLERAEVYRGRRADRMETIASAIADVTGFEIS